MINYKRTKGIVLNNTSASKRHKNHQRSFKEIVVYWSELMEWPILWIMTLNSTFNQI